MEQSELEAMAKEMAKSIKTQEDLGQFTSQLMKVAVEAALGAEMEAHLGYGLNERSDSRRSNHRNGSSKKRLISDHGEIEITTPRDRDGSFDPKIIGKRQSRLTQFDDQILTLYTKGMSTWDIVARSQRHGSIGTVNVAFKGMYTRFDNLGSHHQYTPAGGREV